MQDDICKTKKRQRAQALKRPWPKPWTSHISAKRWTANPVRTLMFTIPSEAMYVCRIKLAYIRRLRAFTVYARLFGARRPFLPQPLKYNTWSPTNASHIWPTISSRSEEVNNDSLLSCIVTALYFSPQYLSYNGYWAAQG